jgi:hypothetical protein
MTNNNEEEPTMPRASQRLEVGSNDVNTTPLEIGFVQYIRSKVQRQLWIS